jgi:hypothetical protein
MMSTTNKSLAYLEWMALSILYKYRDNASSPLKYVGLEATVDALMHHQPPLAQWVGKAAQHQVHITAEGIAHYEASLNS